MSRNLAPHHAQNTAEPEQNTSEIPAASTVLPILEPPPHPTRWDACLPGEHAKAYQAFLDYAQAGSGRSLRKLFEIYQKTPPDTRPIPPVRSLTTLFDWSSRFEWQRRSMEYDYEQQALRRAQMRELRIQRQEQIAEEDWAMSQKLRRVSTEVLGEASKFFNATTTRSPATRDRQGNIIGPERITQTISMKTRDVLTTAKLASEMGRLATGMPTSTLKHSQDFNSMTDAQLLEFLSQHLGEETDHDAAAGTSVTNTSGVF